MLVKSSPGFYLWICLFFTLGTKAQDYNPVLDFGEYLGYVKKYHPIAKQAQLNIAIGEANLMRARGGFDPKIKVDYAKKEFKGTEYWDRLNTTFKIPTWFGVELKGNFEQNQGSFINPDETLPMDGLYSAGVTMSLGQGFWINDRMATLRKAKFFREQSKADQDLQVNGILYKASLAYFDWLRAYLDYNVYDDFVRNADVRLDGIKRRAMAGDMAIIDTVEAKIGLQNRVLGREQAKVKLMKASLELSNFLWINDVPVELQPEVIPDVQVASKMDATLQIAGQGLDSLILENHPKLRSLEFKIGGMKVDKRLKANKLLPKLDVEYNFLTESPEQINSLITDNFKGGVSFRFPLFLRKERGELKLAKFKLRDVQFERDNAQVELLNKITALYQELDSYVLQNQLIMDIVTNYVSLLNAEERKFSVGESSVFLINSRESKLIDAQLKQNELQNMFFYVKAKLFKSLAINPIEL
ncbi:TolC family protein [Flagellimonas algicola]|uniref:TolC family protein n=1 Tax=Flagellimonas algicola TaxID=2583815 RepID=A0ABY2WKR8_9FLAO|nr:TolC family protein [Allomuricauda algicola]TMU55422.1 TolC family protein [Allomuricauda algicola]